MSGTHGWTTTAAAMGLALAVLACDGGGLSERAAEAVVGWIEREAASQATPDDGAAQPAAAADAGTRAAAEETGAAGGGEVRVYYRYADADGSLHFVERRDQIPAAARAGAERIELRRQARDAPTGSSADAVGGGGPAWLRALAQPDPPPRASRVVIYTTPWCGWCRRTRAFLDARGVDYVDKDIEADDRFRRELIRKTGRVSVPVIEIDGELIRGYDERAMEALL